MDDSKPVDSQVPLPSVEAYGNAVILRGPGGKFLPGTRPPNLITKENASALARRGVEKYRRAAAKAVLDEVKTVDLNVKHPYAAWGYLVADQARKLLEKRAPNAQVMEMVGKSVGAFVPVSDGREGGQSTDDTREVLEQLYEIAKAINHSAEGG